MTREQIAELDERWRAAEIAGDNTALDDLSVEDFRLVGPLGFVLTKPQWLACYGGGLKTQELNWWRLPSELMISVPLSTITRPKPARPGGIWVSTVTAT